MPVEDATVVDLISAEAGDPTVFLTIADHLPWSSEEHYEALERKLGAYVGFVESGQLVEEKPEAADRRVVIRLLCLYAPDRKALRFLHAAQQALEQNGLGFSWAMLRES